MISGGAVNSREEVIFVNKDTLAKAPGSKLLMFDAATVNAAEPHVAVGMALGIQVEVPSLETEKPAVSSVLQAVSGGRRPVKKRARR